MSIRVVAASTLADNPAWSVTVQQQRWPATFWRRQALSLALSLPIAAAVFAMAAFRPLSHSNVRMVIAVRGAIHSVAAGGLMFPYVQRGLDVAVPYFMCMFAAWLVGSTLRTLAERLVHMNVPPLLVVAILVALGQNPLMWHEAAYSWAGLIGVSLLVWAATQAFEFVFNDQIANGFMAGTVAGLLMFLEPAIAAFLYAICLVALLAVRWRYKLSTAAALSSFVVLSFPAATAIALQFFASAHGLHMTLAPAIGKLAPISAGGVWYGAVALSVAAPLALAAFITSLLRRRIWLALSLPGTVLLCLVIIWLHQADALTASLLLCTSAILCVPNRMRKREVVVWALAAGLQMAVACASVAVAVPFLQLVHQRL